MLRNRLLFTHQRFSISLIRLSDSMCRYYFAKTVNALKISPYELLLELEEPERNPEVVSLIFELGRLEHKKQKVVLETMKAMINSLSSME